jgi:hypothetical protein
MRERLERTRRARRRTELLLGDHLDDVDAIEIGEDPGRERRLPGQAEAVTNLRIRHIHLHLRRNCFLLHHSCSRSTSHIQMCRRRRTCSSSQA